MFFCLYVLQKVDGGWNATKARLKVGDQVITTSIYTAMNVVPN